MLVGLAHLLIRYCGTADTAQRKRAPTAASPMPGDPKECRMHARNCLQLAEASANVEITRAFVDLAHSDWFPVMSEDELDALAAEDPADPRGASEDEGVKIIRHRAWDYMSDVEPPVEVRVRHKALEQGYRLRRWGPTRTRFTLIDKTKTKIRIGDEIVLTLKKWLDRDRRPM